MKFLTTLLSALSAQEAGTSVRALARLVAVLVVSVAAFSVGFHEVMAYEGRAFSWPTSVYWTVVTMTTLGYGDITFATDLGRMYSLLVLLVGSVLILVLLPFTFIQVVYLPWRRATRRAGAPRSLPASVRDHVVLAGLGPVTEALVDRLRAAGVRHVLLEADVEQALALHDRGYRVAVGDLDDPETYRAVGAERAAMLVAARGDEANTNTVFTWREVTDAGRIVATARSDDAVDILELVGTDHVLRPAEVLGAAFARRILVPSARSTVVARFGDLVVAEVSVTGTRLVGRSLAELRLRQQCGVTVAAVIDRGVLQPGGPDVVVEESAILVLVGTPGQLAAYDEAVDPDSGGADAAPGLVLVLGGGRVGRATARALQAAGTPCRVVERDPGRRRCDAEYVIGDAADRDVLDRAGLADATAVVVTTHDDDVNVYLTLYCRRLRPDVEVLGRVNVDRNLTTMHRAGADMVLSYASTGATEVWNFLRGTSTLLLAEGLVLFRVPVPSGLAGRTLAETDVRQRTGCTVVGVVRDGTTSTDVDPGTVLPAGGEVVLVGTDDAEERFLRVYVAHAIAGDGLLARLRRRVSG